MGGFAGQTAAQFKVEDFGGGNGETYRNAVDLLEEGYALPPPFDFVLTDPFQSIYAV